MSRTTLEQAADNGAEQGRRKAIGMAVETPHERRLRQTIQSSIAQVRATLPPITPITSWDQVKGHLLYLADQEEADERKKLRTSNQ